MGNNEFGRLAIEKVVEYYNNLGVELKHEEVYIVWLCKILGNNKAMLSTIISDKRYYEFTYNGDKNECYLDAYAKVENISTSLD